MTRLPPLHHVDHGGWAMPSAPALALRAKPLFGVLALRASIRIASNPAGLITGEPEHRLLSERVSDAGVDRAPGSASSDGSGESGAYAAHFDRLDDLNIINEPIGDQFYRAPETPSWGLIIPSWIAGGVVLWALHTERLWVFVEGVWG